MGIPGLWKLLGEGELIDIATLAARHFENHKRPLRIAIDEAIWRRKFFLKKAKVDFIRKRTPPANPSEKNILWRVLQLLRLNAQLVFVTDGPNKPRKRNKDTSRDISSETALLEQMLGHLGVAWHKAPGEAEAECAELQRLGIVDCVWTEDSDALMFGADTVLRFKYTPEGKKDNYKVRVFRSDQNLAILPSMDREGMVLFAILCGGDYGPGLHNAGPELAILATKNGLGKLLCQALESGTLPAWRLRLQRFLAGLKKNIDVPEQFPDAAEVRNYYQPLVSSEADLRHKGAEWFDREFNEDELWPFLATRFNLWFKEYVDLIIPIILVQSLARTAIGQESSNSCYQIQWIKADGVSQSIVSYQLAAVTPMDIDERVRTSSNGGWRPEERMKCDGILDVVLRHAVPDIMLAAAPPRASKAGQLKQQQNGDPKSTLSGRKRKNDSGGQIPPTSTSQKGLIEGGKHTPNTMKRKPGRPRNNPADDCPLSEPSKKLKTAASSNPARENIGRTSSFSPVKVTTATSDSKLHSRFSSSATRTNRITLPLSLSPSPTPPMKSFFESMPQAATGEELKRKGRVIIDLVSDDEEQENLPLAPISPNSFVRHKRLALFDLQKPHCFPEELGKSESLSGR